MSLTVPYRILLLDTKRGNPNHYLCLALERAFKENPEVELVTRAHYGDAIPAAISNRCNLFIAFDGEDIDVPLCSKLAKICGRSAVWYTEDPYEIPNNLKTLPLFDLAFTNDGASARRYGEKARHLPLAADKTFHFHSVSQDHRYDLLFVGTAWPNRVQSLKSLIQHLPAGLKYKFALPYNAHLKKPDLGIPESEYSWKASNLEFCRLANQSKIVLTLHRAFSGSKGGETADTPGPRLFEVAAAGGFQLVDLRLEDSQKFLAEGKEMGGFRSDAECVEKVKYYLKHSEERIRFAQAAQNRVLKEHLYKNRVEVILHEVSQLSKPTPSERTGKPQLLVVTHNTLASPPFGGVEIYQDVLSRGLTQDFEVFTYAPLKKGITPYGKLVGLFNGKDELVETFKFSREYSHYDLSDVTKERTFSEVLKKYEIDAVHFQHLVGHPPSLPLIAKSWGLPVFFSLHDFFVGCKNYNLLDYQGKYCGAPDIPIQNCDTCLGAIDGAKPGSQSARRAFISRVLSSVDLFLANTPGIARMFQGFYPQQVTPDKLRILPPPLARFPDYQKQAPSVAPLKIALLGNFGISKGQDFAIELFDRTKDLPIDFLILGHLSETARLEVKKKDLKHVSIHGSFKREEMPKILDGFSLSLHVSPWPETYCMTLSEAWQLKLVPVVTDIGALGERVEHGKTGFKIAVGDLPSLLALLKDLIQNPQKIEAVRARVSAAHLMNEEDHIINVAKAFTSTLKKYPAIKIANSAPLILDLARIGIELNHRQWLIRSGMRSKNPHSLLNSPFADIFKKSISYVKHHGVLNTISRALRELNGGERK